MGVAFELLKQAIHLADPEGGDPSQIDLRRAVSSGYYALFHLLTDDASQRWQGTPEQRTGLERGFEHGPMKNVSEKFQKPTWEDWNGTQLPVPRELQNVAKIFVLLQGQRYLADYHNRKEWKKVEVEELLLLVHVAFRNWDSIRTDPMAGSYLLAMLLKKR